MWAVTIKEFRQLLRDRRLLAMMIVMPLLLLTIFGYAASFDVAAVKTVVVGTQASQVAGRLPKVFEVTRVRPGEGRAAAVDALRRGEATAAVVSEPGQPALLVDGSQLFSARSLLQALGQVEMNGGGATFHPRTEVLFNPHLKTPPIMIPGLMGLVLVFVGTLITSLGVVRERQAGTMEQLAVMPFSPRDVIVGKVLPYLGVAALDMSVVVAAGLLLFDVPFNGAAWLFALASALFLLVALGVGVLVSTASQNQGQAMMLAMMTVLPQVLLSGLVFPVESMAVGVRWIAYLLPLKYFIDVARGVLLRGAPPDALWLPVTMLGALGVAVFGLAILRFRRDLAPKITSRPVAVEPAAVPTGSPR